MDWYESLIWFFVKPWVRVHWAAEQHHASLKLLLASEKNQLCFLIDGTSYVDRLIGKFIVKKISKQDEWPDRDLRLLPFVRDERKRQVFSYHQEIEAASHIVPISIYVGRFPSRHVSILKLWYMESWNVLRYSKKLIALIINGRQTLVDINQPIDCLENNQTLQSMVESSFLNSKNAILGVDFSHRRVLVRELYNSMRFKRLLISRAKKKSEDRMVTRRAADKILYELAADCTQTSILLMDRLLGLFWNRFYDGISERNISRVKEVSKTHRLVYLPCHRSHIDYLVLSYLLHAHKLALPYIAAGENLNLPIIGRLLRGGGAFFIRREFKTDPFYSRIFFEYLDAMLSQGSSIEFFMEGGRSRTGLQLPAKPGMLAMIYKSFLRQHERPVALIPVHISYERIFEMEAYLHEWRGGRKKKESILGLIKTALKLRGKYGKVITSFGRPIDLQELLEKHHKDWSNAKVENLKPLPKWFIETVGATGARLSEAIGENAAVNIIQIIAIIVTSVSDRLFEHQFLSSSIKYLDKLISPQLQPDVTLLLQDSTEMMALAEEINLIKISGDKGEKFLVNKKKIPELHYHKNCVIQVWMPQFLVLNILQQYRCLSKIELMHQILLLAPWIRIMFFISDDRFKTHALDEVLNSLISSDLLFYQNEQVHFPEKSKAGYAYASCFGATIRHYLYQLNCFFEVFCAEEIVSAGDMSKKVKEMIEYSNDQSTGSIEGMLIIDKPMALRLIEYANSEAAKHRFQETRETMAALLEF